jgi:hypothetical protein
MPACNVSTITPLGVVVEVVVVVDAGWAQPARTAAPRTRVGKRIRMASMEQWKRHYEQAGRVLQRDGHPSYAAALRASRISGCLIHGAFIMSDDKSQSQGQDRQRINVNQDYELRDWAKSLNTTPERVKEAVQAVGDRVEKVREYLNGDKPR